MNKWLASIKSIDEAELMLRSLPDILDMKNPDQGALGALAETTVADIVALIQGQCQTSATIGDLPMNAALIGEKITAMAATGVDYIKVGIFPDQGLIGCLQQLKQLVTSLTIPVIAVIFADKPVNENIVIPVLKDSGFRGVMVDTAIKNGNSLLDLWSLDQLTTFINRARDMQLMCGLAGALRYQDIDFLRQVDADYLGFRTALCEQGQRQNTLSLIKADKIKQAMKIAGHLQTA